MDAAMAKELWLIKVSKNRELSEFCLNLACNANTEEAQEIFLDHADKYAKLAIECKLMSLLM